TARELNAELTGAAATLGEGSASPRVWSERFAAARSAAGWPGPLAADGVGAQTRLRWHQLLQELGGLAAGLGAPAVQEAASRLPREGLTESLVDATGRPWTAALPLPRGTRSLDLQNQCPFRAYAELRLGCTRRERVEPGIAPNRRGELLHAALESLWERLGDS